MTPHKCLRRIKASRWVANMPTPQKLSVRQIARHAVQIMDALADTPPRIADAWNGIDDAHGMGASVVADTPLLALADALLQPDPAAWIKHTGNAAPVPSDVLVWFDLGEGRPMMDTAATLAWGAGLGPNGEGRIHRWARVAIPA